MPRRCLLPASLSASRLKQVLPSRTSSSDYPRTPEPTRLQTPKSQVRPVGQHRGLLIARRQSQCANEDDVGDLARRRNESETMQQKDRTMATPEARRMMYTARQEHGFAIVGSSRSSFPEAPRKALAVQWGPHFTSCDG